MLNTVLEFVKNYWAEIISFIFSLSSIIISIIALRRTIISERQAGQEDLFADLKRLLDDRCNCFTSEQKAMGCYSPSPKVSISDEQAITRRVFRIFGRLKYRKLKNILDLCYQAKIKDRIIGKLFNTIKECESEKYSELVDALMNSNQKITDKDDDMRAKFLSTISVQRINATERKSYKVCSYTKLCDDRNKLNQKITKKRASLEKSLNRAMMKR